MKSIIPTTISDEKMVTITQTEYKNLLSYQRFLFALSNSGNLPNGVLMNVEMFEQWENEDE